MDILPPKRPLGRSQSTPPQPDPAPPAVPEPTHAVSPSSLALKKSLGRPLYLRGKWGVIFGILALFLILVVAVSTWYYWALKPLSANDSSEIRVLVASGDSASMVADQLKELGVVRSALAVKVYNELHGTKDKLQAGGYILSPRQSVEEIVNHIVGGKTDEFDVTVLPGLTLKELADPEVEGSLANQGFSQEEIEAAFSASYDSPLLADKPAGESLEGYIFPETYRMSADGKLSSLFKRSFDELYTRLQADGSIEAFKAQGLNLHQAITLASIVQKEVQNPTDQKQVAQVFLKRLKDGAVLGSDVTFFYAAKQMGVEPSVGLDSPYNTRKYAGLPPGPIANMNYSALQAVAHPAPGDYNYFVAGDRGDAGKTFFARTEEEHQRNIAEHCHDLCN